MSKPFATRLAALAGATCDSVTGPVPARMRAEDHRWPLARGTQCTPVRP